MCAYILDFQDIDRTNIQTAGGKGANLGELRRIEGVSVPDGFCISAEAYQKIIESAPALDELFERLALLKADERNEIGRISAEIRKIIEAAIIPARIVEEIKDRLAAFGEKNAYAVRSSATAEDLPTASFAGQQDTYLNVVGTDEILKHTARCWASLFTERAVIYRMQHDFDHRRGRLAVIVQKMIFADAAGVMFTADPLTSNRKIVSIDAQYGLGEALVSGLVNPDIYKTRGGRIIEKKTAVKKTAVYAALDGGTIEREIEDARRDRPVLTDEQILHLEHLGRKIEAHFGCPQDIEWCLAEGEFYIVQSRPITTLFPVPAANDEENHVYVSVGHQQMMTDAFKPLGLSVWNLTTPRPMPIAGGRLFVDVAPMLATAAGRDTLINVLGKSDPLIRDALLNVLDRRGFIHPLSEEEKSASSGHAEKDAPPADYRVLNDYDPAIVTELIGRSEKSRAELKRNIAAKAGAELLDFIDEDLQQMKKDKSDQQSFSVIMTGMNAFAWLNEKMAEWLGEKNAADTLSLSVANNITSEMGLELLDVADQIRSFPQLIEYLSQTKNENFLDDMAEFDGGRESAAAVRAYLDKYGMRCAGEIDITRARWSEKPLTLLPLILGNIKNQKHGASEQKVERGRREALRKEHDLLARLKHLPDGRQKIAETKRMIDLMRNLIGYREYPKYDIVSRYFVYKQALLREAERLVNAGVMREKKDIYYLDFEELREVVVTKKLDYKMIDERKAEYKSNEKLTPPRIITSDGEIIAGRYKRENIPPGAIIGLPVSAGVVEGRARVISSLENAELEEGDILVTAFTDPSWTPLFVSIKGLVTEVGGLMTHGAVIAREYGLPAVVGVENATKLIEDGRQIRIDGTDGYIEIL